MAKGKAGHKARNTKYANDNKALKQRRNWYPTQPTPRRLSRKCKAPRPQRLRSDITPGTVLILLAGRFRGRRVVFLRQLTSGLLLVTGPYKFNGVPLKRVNQAYVLPTRTRVQIGNVASNVDDSFFTTKVQLKAKQNGEVIMPKDDAEKRARVSNERRTTQNNVDTEVKKAIEKVPMLRDYLRNRFALKNGQAPHNLVF